LTNSQCLNIPWSAQLPTIGAGSYGVSVTTNYNMMEGAPDMANNQVLLYVDGNSETVHDKWYFAAENNSQIEVVNQYDSVVSVWGFLVGSACDDNTGSAQVTVAGTQFTLGNSQCLTIPWSAQAQIPVGNYLVSITTDYNMRLGYSYNANNQVLLFVQASSPTAHDKWYWAVEDGDVIEVLSDQGSAAVWVFFADSFCGDNTGSAQVTLTRQQ